MTPMIVATTASSSSSPAVRAGGRSSTRCFASLVNVLDFDMDVQAAVDAPRMHQQWFPDQVQLRGPARPCRGDSPAASHGARAQNRAAGRRPLDLGRPENGHVFWGSGQTDQQQGSGVLTTIKTFVCASGLCSHKPDAQAKAAGDGYLYLVPNRPLDFPVDTAPVAHGVCWS